MEPIFSPQEKSLTLHRAAGRTKAQSADSLGLEEYEVHDCHKAIHKKIRMLTGIETVTAPMVLAVGVVYGEITRQDLLLFFASMGVYFNNLP
jgi:hypothetical protein